MTPGRLVPLTRDRVQAAELDGWRPAVWPMTERNGDDPRLRGWAEHTLADWGHCGVLAQHDGAPVGVLVVVPAGRVPHVGAFETTTFGADAAVVAAASVAPGWTRQGIGRQLVQSAAADLAGRGYPALEALGSTTGDRGGLPEGWLTAVGFRLVRAHPLTPRYRMDLSTSLRWRPDLTAAWHRLRGLVSRPATPEPARFETDPRLVPAQGPTESL